MKAIFLIRTGLPEKAFEIRETKIPEPRDNELLIKVEGSGLNFADIVAREGQYRDAPALPGVLGYDVVGRVTAFGKKTNGFSVGDRVTALTRFGGYAEYAVTDFNAAAKIPEFTGLAAASALATQCCTAYYCAAMAANLRNEERVVIHSASGGVGSSLLQFANLMKCEVYATTTSSSKLSLLKKQGVSCAINTSEEDFFEVVREKTRGDGVDVIFDALGGSFVRKGVRLLAPGGRIVCYGASTMSGANLFSRIKTGLQFGFYHPAQFMLASKSLIGVNMLHIADRRPQIIRQCLAQVMELFRKGIFIPHEGKIFHASDVAAAHRFLQERKAFGKVVLSWLSG